MPGNSFGHSFRITTCGESHGGAVGVIVDGCPPGLPLSEEDIQPDLDRRRPGQSDITTPRKEADTIQILSGVFEGKTTGTPILLLARNQDARPGDYGTMKDLYRPSHADFTYERKYGFRDWRGSGRASARETLARVAAGAIARKYLSLWLGVRIWSYVEQVGQIRCPLDYSELAPAHIDQSIVRCPDDVTAQKMIALIEEVRDQGDSIGGVIRGVIQGCPAGLGDPVFDKFNSDLGKGMLSINAVKGFEIGSGFHGVSMRGSEHNDPLVPGQNGEIRSRTNRAGGVVGGITNGEDIVFRVAFKPVATISKEQETVDRSGKAAVLASTGRHDPCVLPRAVPIVDAMAAIVAMDHFLRARAQQAPSGI